VVRLGRRRSTKQRRHPKVDPISHGQTQEKETQARRDAEAEAASPPWGYAPQLHCEPQDPAVASAGAQRCRPLQYGAGPTDVAIAFVL
jgi:hypothetical protein